MSDFARLPGAAVVEEELVHPAVFVVRLVSILTVAEDVQQREVLSRRRPVITLKNPARSISFVKKLVLYSLYTVYNRSYMSVLCPRDKIWMINLALRIDMLSGPHGHSLSRNDIDHGSLAWIGMGYPQGDRKAIGGASKKDREGTRQLKQKGRCAILRCYTPVNMMNDVP